MVWGGHNERETISYDVNEPSERRLSDFIERAMEYGDCRLARKLGFHEAGQVRTEIGEGANGNMDFFELEFGLRREADSYTVELRVSRPDSDAETREFSRLPADKIDIASLHQQKFDVDVHGRRLSAFLFADTKVKTAFAKARAVADASNATLRVRLFVGPGAPELHGLYWEALRDPDDDSPLFIGERILLSRYLSSADWRRVRRRPKAELHALVVIASPTDVESDGPGGRRLAALNVPAELARAKAGLEGIACAELASGGAATLDGLVTHLRDGCDVLYLVCHGALIEGEP